MNICDKIEVATIAIDETTILEIKAPMALYSDLTYDKVSRTIKAKTSGRHVQDSAFRAELFKAGLR